MATHHAKPTKLRWGELEEDDGEDLDFLLPPRQVIGPDENDVKKIIEYKFDDAVHEDVGSRLTMVSTEEMRMNGGDERLWGSFGSLLVSSERCRD
ncbi:uncharacterized protein HKW66_Vig0129140 [Vigna angularis]|uniref:Uncharacterized protein n=1 Tax=Phaseolus angularis TaxID=3914 RepID=A0A8T0K6J8_PHAAN|nr:uncharacterized protein HKW66_Vig0129140 [Vigna angularis]